MVILWHPRCQFSRGLMNDWSPRYRLNQWSMWQCGNCKWNSSNDDHWQAYYYCITKVQYTQHSVMIPWMHNLVVHFHNTPSPQKCSYSFVPSVNSEPLPAPAFTTPHPPPSKSWVLYCCTLLERHFAIHKAIQVHCWRYFHLQCTVQTSFKAAFCIYFEGFFILKY